MYSMRIMVKRNASRLATIVCGLLSLIISTRSWQWQEAKSMGVALGLLSAIFATQWIYYQKRQDAVSGHPSWPGWLRRLLY